MKWYQEVMTVQKLKDGGDSSQLESGDVLSAVEAILKSVDQDKLAMFFARKTPEEGIAADEAKKEMESKKNAVIQAYRIEAKVYTELRVSI